MPIRLKLIRLDYDPDAIPELTNDKTLGKPRIAILNLTSRRTGIEVEFTNRAKKYDSDTIPASRLANSFAAANRRAIQKLSFPWCTSQELAKSIAAREMGTLGRPMLAIQVPVKREFYASVPGDVLLVNLVGYVESTVFRIQSADHGQLADGAVVLQLLEDIFSEDAGAFPGPVVDPLTHFLLPIHERLLTETPAWIQRKLYAAGVLTAVSADPDEPLAYAFAIAANSKDGTGYDDNDAQSFKTKGTDLFVPSTLSDDKPLSGEWLRNATVKTEYPRTADPYDTTVGLELEDVTTALDSVFTTLGASEYSDSDIATYAASLSVLYDPDTDDHEFIAWKASEAITGGRKLTKVWRGLFDTAPRTWPVGTRFVHLHLQYGNSVGRTPRLETQVVDEQFVPSGSALTGSGDDPIDAVTIDARQAKPMPVSDFTIAGPDLVGTQGDPPNTGLLKAVSLFDGHGFAFGNRRSKDESLVLRGDDVSAPAATETYTLLARKVPTPGDPDPETVEILSGLGLPGNASYWQLGAAGHGDMDVSLKTVASDAPNRESFTNPTVRTTAPHWRNLIVNSHAIGGFSGTVASALGWTNVTGTVQASQGTSSPSQSSTGAYFTAATAAGSDPEVTAFRQDVPVSGFRPEGMTAILDFYYRNLSADADDTIEVELEALDENSDSLSVSDTTGTLVGDADLWTRETLTLTLPTNTAFVRVTVTLSTAGANTTPLSAFAEPTLRLGQASEQLLFNPTFEETAIDYTFDAVVDEPADASSFDAEGGTQDLHCVVQALVGNGDQTNAAFTVEVADSYGASKIDSIATSALDGWSEAGWAPSGGVWVNVYTKASVVIGTYDIEFDITFIGGGLAACPLTIATSAPFTDQIASGAGNSVDVDVNDSGVPITWTVDATSGIACPADATEWADFISANGLSIAVPDYLWLMQDASSGAAAAIGSISLVEEGSRIDYMQTVTGWSRKAIKTRGDALLSTSASLPDLSTTSMTLLGYASIVDAGLTVDRMLFGTSAFSRIQTMNTNLPRILTGGFNSVNAASSINSDARPIMFKYDTTGNTIALYMDTERISIATDTDPSGKKIWFTGTVSPGFSYWLLGAGWVGSAAEISNANAKAFLVAANWSIPWT